MTGKVCRPKTHVLPLSYTTNSSDESHHMWVCGVLRRQVWWQWRGGSCRRLGRRRWVRTSNCFIHATVTDGCRETCCCSWHVRADVLMLHDAIQSSRWRCYAFITRQYRQRRYVFTLSVLHVRLFLQLDLVTTSSVWAPDNPCPPLSLHFPTYYSVF